MIEEIFNKIMNEKLDLGIEQEEHDSKKRVARLIKCDYEMMKKNKKIIIDDVGHPQLSNFEFYFPFDPYKTQMDYIKSLVKALATK